jgi:IPT/TIG domain
VIQDTQSFQSNLPVQRRSLVALPLISPVIESVSPTMTTLGQTLTINGSNFLGDTAADTLVSFNGAQPVPAATVQGNCVRVPVPATLMSGVSSVRVIRNVTFPSSTRPHSGFTSNPAPFQLVPTIQPAATPPFKVNQLNPLTLTLSPVVGNLQTVVVYIGDQAVPMPPTPLTGPTTSATVTVTVPNTVDPGVYPLRVEVDGAQSKLTLDTNPASPTFNKWLPQVEVSA